MTDKHVDGRWRQIEGEDETDRQMDRNDRRETGTQIDMTETDTQTEETQTVDD